MGLVSSRVGVNATSMVPASVSASTRLQPSVAAAGGIGARPFIASQNGPDGCDIRGFLPTR